TISLLGLAEVVMSDGTRYSNVVRPGTDTPLTALITGSGAGGLDTGSEQAATWYEGYVIGKSSTKLNSDLRLMLHRAKDYLVDQSFTTATNAGRALRLATSTATDLLAEGFKVATVGKIERIDIPILRAGAVSGNIWMEIRSDSAGSPSSTVLATSDKENAGVISTTEGYIAFLFRNPFTPADTSTQYHMVLNADYTRSDAVNITWRGVAAGGYANGVAKEFNGTTWANASGVGDFDFKLYVTENDTALTFPAGYDQSVKLGTFFNNSGSDFNPLGFYDRTAIPLALGTIASAFGTTTPVLTDLSVFFPPGRTLFRFATANPAGASAITAGGVPDGFGITGANDTQRTAGGSGVGASGAIGANTGTSDDVATEFQAGYFAAVN